MSRKANIDDFFESAQTCLEKHQNGDPISDKELSDGLIFLSKVEDFAIRFDMELLRYWTTMRGNSLDNIDFHRKTKKT